MEKKIVIIGGVAGGASAAARARRLSEQAEIVLVERGPYVSFANCGLPYYLGGEITSRDALLLHTPESLRQRFGLRVLVRHQAQHLDLTARRVDLMNLETGEVVSEEYSDLVLATGAAPLRPPIPGVNRPGHFSLRSLEDMDAIEAWIRERSPRRAVVVGGGFIGLEMTEQLVRRGLQVTVAEALPQVMRSLDPEMAALVHEELERRGVALHLDDGVASFEAPASEAEALASVVRLESGATLPADMVLLALGVRPELELARDAGLELGRLGGLRVNERLRTSDPNVWAIGDAIEVRDPVTDGWHRIPLAGPANRQGRIVAENILGCSSTFRGTQGTSILRVFDLVVASTGASEERLDSASIPYDRVHLHPGSHAGYYPGARTLHMKVLFHAEDGRLLGAQVIGEDGVDKRIDVLATALAAGMTVHDVAELELAYAPPFGSAKDPVNLAGMVASNVLDGNVRQAHWDEVDFLDPEEAVVLDVRTAREREQDRIEGSLHIPLHELRDRLGEVPRDREVIVHCRSGQRSYMAHRILEQNGFQSRNLSGGMLTYLPARRDMERGGGDPKGECSCAC